MEGAPKHPEWPAPRRPGWVRDPEQGTFVWWDGRRFTARATWDGTSWRSESLGTPSPGAPSSGSAASRLARSLTWGLLGAGGGIVAWGFGRVREKPCSTTSSFTVLDPGPLWLPWLALVGVVGLLVVVWRATAPDVGWVKDCAVAAVVIALLAFPVVPFAVSAPNCSL